MKYQHKLKVFFLIFVMLFAQKTLAADKILPIPKPGVDQETKTQTAKKKEIYPKKKPTLKKEKAKISYNNMFCNPSFCK